MKSGRGRPKLNSNIITINELVVEYLSTKADKWDNEIVYFKIVDPSFRAKLKPLFSVNDEGLLKMPIWLTDKNEHLFKVKAKFVNNLQEFVNNALYLVNINFEYYHMEGADVDKEIKGYDAKTNKVVNTTPPPGIDIEENENN